jgi:hypothetical protein
MSTLLQTLPVAFSQKEALRTTFASDDDLFLPISIYLDSREGSKEIIEDIIEVVRAYDFNNISPVYQAPGSFYIHFKAGFKSDNHEAARQSKRELNADLLDKKPPAERKRRRTVKKLKGSFLRRARKKMGSAMLIGVVFVGSAIGGMAKDVAKDEIKAFIEEQLPRVAQKLDKVGAKELPPPLAAKFHEAIEYYITKSPDKSELHPPGGL